MDSVLQDIRFGVRTLLKSRSFATVAALTLALGIGATTAIFSVVHAVLLRPLPYADPDRIVFAQEVWREQPSNVSAGNWADWRAASRSFEHFAAVQYSSFNLTGGELPERVVGARVSADYFGVFGVRPLLGRTFLPEEDRPGHGDVVVLSHRLWARRFGFDRRLLGRTLAINGRPHLVVGVMPPSFDLTADGEALWVPIAFTAERLAMHDEHYLTVFGRLRRGVTLERAQAEANAIARTLAERFPNDNRERGLRVSELREELVRDYRTRLLVLLGAVVVVLLIACVNVANLQLARAAARAREIAVRTALGAGRWRIARQLLTESVVLAFVGGAAGLLLAFWGIEWLVASSPEGVPRLDRARVDGTVLAFTLALTLASALVFGLAPALRAASPALHEVLKEGGRTAAAGTARDRVRAGLVVAEVALALTLLVGAGLLVRSAILLQRVRPGFDSSQLLTARIALPQASYAEPERVRLTFERVLAELAASPTARAAAVVSREPLGGGGSNGLIPAGRPLDPASAIDATFRLVSPGYFETLRIPLKRGRTFAERDDRDGARVIVINETLARRAWPNENPIGKRIACCEGGPDGTPVWKEVVGVVGDVRAWGLGDSVRAEFYLPLAQAPDDAWNWIQRTMTVVLRTSGDPRSAANGVRRAVAAVDPALPVYRIATMDERIAESFAQARFNTALLTALGVVGLALAAVGIYGVVGYFVSQRTREIGVRMALGASAGSVLALVVRQAVVLTLVGVAFGIGGALVAARVLRTLVYGVSTSDPLTYAGVAVLLTAVAAAAGYLPARRATRVDPVVALRTE